MEPNEPDMVFIRGALASAGFIVRAADNFREAKSLLITHPPLVLVTEIRLGAFNGLQLALRAGSTTPRIPVVVTSRFHDPVLQRDAESTGATFALKPLTRDELLAVVYRTALRRSGPGADDPIRVPFERRYGERRHAQATDLELERRNADRRRDIARLLLRGSALS